MAKLRGIGRHPRSSRRLLITPSHLRLFTPSFFQFFPPVPPGPCLNKRCCSTTYAEEELPLQHTEHYCNTRSTTRAGAATHAAARSMQRRSCRIGGRQDFEKRSTCQYAASYATYAAGYREAERPHHPDRRASEYRSAFQKLCANCRGGRDSEVESLFSGSPRKSACCREAPAACIRARMSQHP